MSDDRIKLDIQAVRHNLKALSARMHEYATQLRAEWDDDWEVRYVAGGLVEAAAWANGGDRE